MFVHYSQAAQAWTARAITFSGDCAQLNCLFKLPRKSRKHNGNTQIAKHLSTKRDRKRDRERDRKKYQKYIINCVLKVCKILWNSHVWESNKNVTLTNFHKSKTTKFFPTLLVSKPKIICQIYKLIYLFINDIYIYYNSTHSVCPSLSSAPAPFAQLLLALQIELGERARID